MIDSYLYPPSLKVGLGVLCVLSCSKLLWGKPHGFLYYMIFSSANKVMGSLDSVSLYVCNIMKKCYMDLHQIYTGGSFCDIVLI